MLDDDEDQDQFAGFLLEVMVARQSADGLFGREEESEGPFCPIVIIHAMAKSGAMITSHELHAEALREMGNNFLAAAHAAEREALVMTVLTTVGIPVDDAEHLVMAMRNIDEEADRDER